MSPWTKAAAHGHAHPAAAGSFPNTSHADGVIASFGPYYHTDWFVVAETAAATAFPRPLHLAKAHTRSPLFGSRGADRPRDDYWIFTTTLAGEGWYDSGHGRRRVRRGEGFLVRANDSLMAYGYDDAARRPWSWAWMTFSAGAAEPMVRELAALQSAATLPADGAFVRRMLAYGAHPPTNAWGIAHVEIDVAQGAALVFDLLVTLTTAAASADSARRHDDALARAKRRLDASLRDDLEVGRIAHDVGLSREHFTRAFAQRYGLPPHRYMLARRIKEASYLLAHTTLAVAQVARDMGFASSGSFSRAFARATGLAPAAWRDRSRG